MINQQQYYFEKDFSNDLWCWSKIHDDIKNNISNIDQIQQNIIKDSDPGLAYFCALYLKYKTHLMQKVVLESKSPKYAYAFTNIPNADINALQQIVLNSNSIKYICYFGLYVAGADTRKIERILIKSGQAKWAHMWLSERKSVYNMMAIKALILNSNKPQFLFALAKRLKQKKEIIQIQNRIIASNSLLYMRLFAAQIKGAEIEKLEAAVMESGDLKEIKRFAKDVRGSTLGNFKILF